MQANVHEGAYEVEGILGDVFKLSTPEQDEQYVTIAENSTLKEVNHIVFEDFTYSVTRRWYNILQNTGTFRGQIEEPD